jgi:hypothetical protein
MNFMSGRKEAQKTQKGIFSLCSLCSFAAKKVAADFLVVKK